MAKTKIAYITYNEGLDSKHLHLGNLVHDFKNPSFHDPHVEKSYTDIQDPAPEWANSTALESYALTLGEGAEQGHDAANPTSSSADEPGVKKYRVVAAEKTNQIEIKDPEAFFENITLSSPAAKKWLASHLSASETLSKSRSNSKPEIWMLTGLILMQHATWTSLSSKEPGFVAGQKAPLDPSGISSIRRLSISENIKPTFGFRGGDEETKSVGGVVVHETGKYPGTRGWAARWQRVEVMVGGDDRWKEGVNNLLKLKDGVAIMRVNEDIFARNEGGKDVSVDLNDEYWDAFLDAIDD